MTFIKEYITEYAIYTNKANDQGKCLKSQKSTMMMIFNVLMD